MTDSYCFITPSYLGDIDRFAVLRESVMRYAPTIKHLAVIQTEHFRHFHTRFGHQPNLTLIRTSEVLPTSIEMRRGGNWCARRMTKLQKRIHRTGGLIDGWRAQQLTKIFTLSKSEFEIGIFLDSDLFLCQPFNESIFITDGKPNLFVADCHNLESLSLWIAATEIQGLNQLTTTETKNFVFAPAVFRKTTAKQLLHRMNELHSHRWVDVFCRERKPSEYNILGITAFATGEISNYHVQHLKNPGALHIEIDCEHSDIKTAAQIAKSSGRPFFLIQSNTRIPPTVMQSIFAEMVAMDRR